MLHSSSISLLMAVDFGTLQLRFQKRTLQSNLMNLSRGHEQKKGDFLELFGLPRNLGLKLSLDNKTWRNKNRKKMMTSILILMPKSWSKNMPKGPLFNL